MTPRSARTRTFTLDLNYDGDVAADRPVVWQIFWGDEVPGEFGPIPEKILGDPSTASHVYTDAGVYNVLGVVTNDDSSSYFAFWTVTVGDKPVADAGGPYTTLLDTPITLTGVGTNGVGLTYAWDLDNNGDFDVFDDVVTFDPGGVAGPRTVKFNGHRRERR